MARSPFGAGTATPNTNPSVTYSPPTGGARPGMKIRLGQEMYLWLLVAIELLLMVGLRMQFRNRHGG